MNLKIGDKVNYLDAVGTGTVVAIGIGVVSVEDTDGFIFDYLPSEVVLAESPSYEHSFENIDPNQEGEQENAKGGIKKGRPEFYEVDLHIHHLVSSDRNLSNREMVLIQLEHVKLMWNKAIERRDRKLVFIHGVGAGTLKSEIIQFLKMQPNCEFGNASIANYGYGATEVKMWYN